MSCARMIRKNENVHVFDRRVHVRCRRCLLLSSHHALWIALLLLPSVYHGIVDVAVPGALPVKCCGGRTPLPLSSLLSEPLFLSSMPCWCWSGSSSRSLALRILFLVVDAIVDDAVGV